ncbi:hypothetical protein BG015_007439 [Linnemannia schmuckeri]|uniref:Ndc10 domain-containing protein n=1 Tax=Linnemannia schmuckeri TaxID=64567 RepID=A0A9P5VB46_9FUNG|nr:hypothetical protein BG015_007439 [Linnemannia schmuckeri]
MKVLLKLSLAALLVSSTFGLTLQEFVRDPQVQTLAPHLLQEIDAKGTDSFTVTQDSSLIPDMHLPVLTDIVQFVSLNIFHAGDADWSRLEAAKLQAIEKHGAESLTAASDLKDIDTRRAALIVNTIYDTVIGLPAPSKETYAAKVEAVKKDKVEAESKAEEEKKNKAEADKKEAEAKEQAEAEKKASTAPSSLWEYLGVGLIKSSETVKMAKGIVSPRAVCETTDTAYLKGVEDVVYYSSLTHGLAGGALISAPADSPVHSLDLKTIVGAVGKLAIEIQMAQSVARLAELNPTDLPVRALTYLALTSESSTSSSAQNARDIHNLIDRGLTKEIPESLLRSLINQAALGLITKGAGEAGESPSVFESIPGVRNLFAFSSDVLSANNLGDVLKYVFCPDSNQATEPPKAEVVVEDIKGGAENVAEKASEGAQKVLKVPQEAAKKASENVKEEAEAVQDKAAAAAEDASKKIKSTKDEASAKAAEAAAKIQDKVADGTKKVNEAGEKLARDAKDKAAAAKKAAEDASETVQKKAEGAQKKAQEVTEEGKKKAQEVTEEGKKKAQEVTEKGKKKAGDVKQKVADEAKNAADKAAAKTEEIKEELLNQGFRSAVPEPQEEDEPFRGSRQQKQKQQQQQQQGEESASSLSPSSSTSSSMAARKATTTDGKATEPSAASRQSSAAVNQLLAAVAQGQGSSANGTLSSTSELSSPEERFIADMNDLTEIRKSSHQTYTPTMRRWKDFCERHKEEYGGPDGRAVYLVDSEDKVGKFLEEEVLIRTKSKRQKSMPGSSGEGSPLFVEVAVGPDAVKMARSSLGRIHRLQMGRKEVGELAPSDMKIFHTKIELCQKALDEREDAQPGSTRGRDYYSLDNMVTVLNLLWDGPDPRKEGHNFMEMFCISATHNMLLQDEELHRINFSDCFAVVPTQNRHPEAQQRVALTFKLMNNDPTSDANQNLCVSALRHYDVSRCAFSAFAFYMFQIWQGATERDPRSDRTLSAIFRDLGKDEWPLFKLLPSTGDPTVSSLPTTVWAMIKKNFKSLGVNYPRKTDGGRHVGTAEASKLKIPQDDIDDKGRWSVERGTYGDCQIPELLTSIPDGMAGFLDKPYSLARNKVSPPIPLQMLIFPWIEFAFGVDNAWWKQECLNEMNEVIKDSSTATPSTKASRKDSKAGPNGAKAASGRRREKVGASKGKQVERDNRADEDNDDEDSGRDEASDVEEAEADFEAESDAESALSAQSTPISTAQGQEARGSGDEDGTTAADGLSPPTAFSEANRAKAGFLRLLVRCRRIVLQDAAYRLHRNQPNKILDHDIFRCTMFKSFQQEIGAAADKDAALSRKHPRQKSPSTTSAPIRPISAAGAQPPLQKQQQDQHADVIGLESPPTTGHHQQQQQQHRQPAPGALYRFGGEKPFTQPASTSDHHHHHPHGHAHPPSTFASLEQQMLQLQHMVQAWGQHQETQMQQMFAQHMKIHEMQQQMITTMMAALRTQQSTQLQFQWPPAGSSTSASSPHPTGYQQPNGVSPHATEPAGATATAAAAVPEKSSWRPPSSSAVRPAVVPATSKSKSFKEPTTFISYRRK